MFLCSDYLSVYLKMSALLQAAKAFTSKITDMKRESDDVSRLVVHLHA